MRKSRNYIIQTRVNEDEKVIIKKDAKKAKLKVSEYIRSKLF